MKWIGLLRCMKVRLLVEVCVALCHRKEDRILEALTILPLSQDPICPSLGPFRSSLPPAPLSAIPPASPIIVPALVSGKISREPAK